MGFTQKSKHAALRNRGPESSKTRHRGEEKKRTQKAHMKKPNEQQQSDLRDRGDQKYAHPQDTHKISKEESKLLQPTATTTYVCPPITSLRNSNSLTPRGQKKTATITKNNNAEQKNKLKNTTSKRSCPASEDIFLDLRKHTVHYTCTSSTRSKQRNAHQKIQCKT